MCCAVCMGMIDRTGFLGKRNPDPIWIMQKSVREVNFYFTRHVGNLKARSVVWCQGKCGVFKDKEHLICLCG